MRIVILTYESLFSNLMTERVLNEFPQQVVGIVRSERLIHGKTLTEGLLFLLRKTGLRFVGRKALEFFQSRATAIIFRLIGRQAKVNALRTMKTLYQIPIVGATDVNSPETENLIASWSPDLIISIYFNQLIKRNVIDLATIGTLNIHPALLPKHRGLFPYFWVLANQETQTGVTLHWVDEAFDTGEILLQKTVTVSPNDTITSLSHKCATVGATMLVEGIKSVETGSYVNQIQDSNQASYHSWPKPADQHRFRQAGGRYGTIFELWKYM